MTRSQAERVLGVRLVPEMPGEDKGNGGACWRAIEENEAATNPAVLYMIRYGRIVRIDVMAGSGAPTPIRTEAGIGIGSTLIEAIQAYVPPGVRIDQSRPDGPAYWLTVQTERGRIRFRVDESRVSSFWISQAQYMDLYEGCY